jgi:lauroyl/myristoyl acyltransferase
MGAVGSVARVTGATTADRLAAVEVASSHLFPADDRPLRARLHARPGVRRALGRRRAVRIARARGRVEWALARPARAAALARARALLGPDADAGEIRRLARAHLVELAIQGELSWHPWEARRMPVRGLEHLEAARAAGRGTIIAPAHAGAVYHLLHALAGRGHKVYVVWRRRPDHPLPAGAPGRWIRAQHASIERAGGRFVYTGDAFEVLAALLERGELCWLNWDVPGTLPVRVLDRPARVRSGIARLARQTGAPVVPALVWREGDGQVAELLPALDPAGHAGDRELLEELVRRVEPLLRPRLAQVEPFFTTCLDVG